MIQKYTESYVEDDPTNYHIWPGTKLQVVTAMAGALSVGAKLQPPL